jgi:hypothetical protein
MWVSSYHLLVGAHVGPSALALLLDSTLGSLGTKVVGNDSAGVLHVQEIGGERPLGGVGVMSALLALLLLLDRRGEFGHRHHELSGGILKVGEDIAMADIRARLAEQKVGLADVVGSELPQNLDHHSESTDGLQAWLV